MFTYSYAFGTSVSVVDVIVNDVNHNPILEGAQIYAQDLIDGLQERFSEEGRSILASFDSCIWNICQMMRRNVMNMRTSMAMMNLRFSRLILECELTHSCVWYDSFTCVT